MCAFINILLMRREANLCVSYSVLFGCIFWYEYFLITGDQYLYFFFKTKQNKYSFFFTKVDAKPNYKLSVLRRRNFNFFNYFVGLICRRGQKLKAVRFLKYSFREFFELFIFCASSRLPVKYNYFYVINSYLSTFYDFYSINFFLENILPLFECMYTLRVSCNTNYGKISKKKRVEHEQYKTKLVYLKPKNRMYPLIRFMYYNTDNYRKFSFKKNLFCVLVDTFLSMKYSLLYERKIAIYKRLIIFKEGDNKS